MANSRKIRIAVVGAGHVAQVAHIPAWKSHPDVELAAIVDDDVVRVRHVARQFGFKTWHRDFSRMLKDADVNAVDICTPNYLHAPMVIAALRSGRDVLCEKPLARSAAEAQKMVDASDKYGRMLMVAMNNRFREDVSTLHRLIKAGELGDVQVVKAGWQRKSMEWKDRVWFTEKGKAGGGALLDLGTPLMDLAIWMSHLRRPVSTSCAAYGKKGRNGVEDSACALVRFAGGASLMLDVNWNLREKTDRTYLNVFGSKGAAMLNPLQIHKSIHGVLVNVTPSISRANYYKKSYQEEIKHFVACRARRRKPLSSGREAVTVLRILDAMYASAASGREVEIPA